MEFYQNLALNHIKNLSKRLEKNYFKDRQDKIDQIKKNLN